MRIFRHQEVILDITPEELLALYEKAKNMKNAKTKGILGNWCNFGEDNISIIMKLDDMIYNEHTLGLKIKQIENETF